MNTTNENQTYATAASLGLNADLSIDKAALAGARATAEIIDQAVASGRPLTEVLSAYDSGQLFWVKLAQPFSKALTEAEIELGPRLA